MELARRAVMGGPSAHCHSADTESAILPNEDNGVIDFDNAEEFLKHLNLSKSRAASRGNECCDQIQKKKQSLKNLHDEKCHNSLAVSSKFDADDELKERKRCPGPFGSREYAKVLKTDLVSSETVGGSSAGMLLNAKNVILEEAKAGIDVLRKEIEKGTNKEILLKEEMLKKLLKCPPYRCFVAGCGKIYHKWLQFVRHLREHQSAMPFSCTKCKSTFRCRADLASHLKRHLGMKNIQCKVCGDLFEKSRGLVSHMVTQHGSSDLRPRNFKCTDCGEAFLSKSAVDRHMRFHTGFRPEVCQFCGSCFHTEFDLKEHLRIHSGEKPYKCDLCPYAARTSQLLKRHKKSHSDDRPFSCEKCTFKCNNAQSLKRHEKKHSKLLSYKCPYCEHRCNNMDNLKKHIKKVRKHAGLKVYPCMKCPFSTDKSAAYLKHLKQIHFPHLDMRTATASKLSGILVESGVKSVITSPEPADLLSPYNGVDEQQSNSFLNHQCVPAPGYYEECTTEQAYSSSKTYNKGDIMLSSIASNDSDASRKEGAFPSGSFNEVCWAQPLCDATSRCAGDGMELVGHDDESDETHQAYIAVLVELPAGKKIELQHEYPSVEDPDQLRYDENSHLHHNDQNHSFSSNQSFFAQSSCGSIIFHEQ